MALHHTRLSEFASPSNPIFQNALGTMNRALGGAGERHR